MDEGLDLSLIPSTLRDDLLRTIISSLYEPEKTAVARQYDNQTLTAEDNKPHSNHKAKLVGRSWNFRLKSDSVTIGRNTDTFNNTFNWSTRAGLDIDLGPSKTVSRNHAKINFDERNGKWVFTSLGRNGAKINGKRVKPTDAESSVSVSISNGALIEVGGVDMMFLVSDMYPKYTQKTLDVIATRLFKHYKLESEPINVVENPFTWGIIRYSKYYNSRVRDELKIKEGTVPVQKLKLEIELEKIRESNKKKETQESNVDRSLPLQEEGSGDHSSHTDKEKLPKDSNIIPKQETVHDNDVTKTKGNAVTDTEMHVSQETDNFQSSIIEPPKEISKTSFYTKYDVSKSDTPVSDEISGNSKNLKNIRSLDETGTTTNIDGETAVNSKRQHDNDIPDERTIKQPKFDVSRLQKELNSNSKALGDKNEANASVNPDVSFADKAVKDVKLITDRRILSDNRNGTAKPKDSYATLITKAILSSPSGERTLSEILKYISDEYPYFKTSTLDWPNSVRHNLSVNKKFEKISKRANAIGKGNNWRISLDYQQEFLQKWKKGTLKFMKKTDAVDRQLLLYISKHGDLPRRQAPDDSPKRITIQSMSEAPGSKKLERTTKL
ncbi:Forkhead domain [Nakaseomyces glabratus]